MLMKPRFLMVTLLIAIAFGGCSKDNGQKAEMSVAVQPAATVTPPPPASVPLAPRYEASLSEGIDFRKPGYPSFLSSVTGMSGFEPQARWSEGRKVVFEFNNPLPKRFTLVLDAASAFGPNVGKPFQVKVGSWSGEFVTTGKPETLKLDVETDQPAKAIEMEVPAPTSPKEVGVSSDPRELGIWLAALRIES